ncbi:MAG: hypothetical protein FD149_2654 [Rhodospirillaceae bacterium]|nr:MAG: hypothetical protein FD149_2654 [Rhodospirillaceae bacterium]
MPPRPAHPMPQKSTPPITPNGEPLDAALNRFVRYVKDNNPALSGGEKVTALQNGLNLFNAEGVLRRKPQPGAHGFLPLKEDGDPGPKTRAALRQTLARLGPNRVTEAYALGRFNTFARTADPDALKTETESIFTPLYPRTRAAEAHPLVAEALQDTLNQLAGEDDDRDFVPLKVDGAIGPKTQAGFARILARVGPDSVTRRLARTLALWRH